MLTHKTKGHTNPQTNELAGLAIELGRLTLRMKLSPLTCRSLSVPCLNDQGLGATGAISGVLKGRCSGQMVPAVARALLRYSLTKIS